MGVRETDHRLPNENRPQRRKPRDDDRTIEEWAEYIKTSCRRRASASATAR